MATATLSHRHIFGLKADVKDNIWFVDENLIVYPVGHNAVVYNCETRLQKFMHGTEGTEGITALTLSPSKRFVAVAEKADQGIVNVFDLHTLRRRKVYYFFVVFNNLSLCV